MSTHAMPLGYRIAGPCDRERRLVDYDKAFAAYAGCDDLAQIDEQGFLSPFQYDEAIRHRDNGYWLDVSGFDGICWSRYVWFDIDDVEIEAATDKARRLCVTAIERYRLDESSLLAFYSGSKGYHVGLPTSLFVPEPSVTFHKAVRRLAEQIAEAADIAIDTAVYNKVQPLRAPNSRHGKTNRHKRILAVDELLLTRPSAIVDRAAEPLPFDLPKDPATNDRAIEDWAAACLSVREQIEAARRCDTDRTELNRSTLAFIRDGADRGDRHRLLYSAAANLAEMGCPPSLAHALLTESALDSGLPPSDIRRAIDNGLQRTNGREFL